MPQPWLFDFYPLNRENAHSMRFWHFLQKNLGFKIAFWSTLVLGGVFLASLLILFNLEPLQKNNDIWVGLSLAGFSALVLQFVITALTCRMIITRRLNSLRDTMKEIEEGKLHVNLDVNSSDEIGSVFETFNHMLSRMQEMHERKKNVEKKLVKTEESLRYKIELENKNKIIERMNQELTQSFNTVALLYNVSQKLNAALDLDELLESVKTIFDNKFPCHQYLLYFTGADDRLNLVGHKGFLEHVLAKQPQIEIGEGLLGSVANTEKTLHIENMSQTTFVKSGLENEIHGSAFISALMARGKLIGVLLVSRLSNKAFSSADCQALEAIATQIANSYDRSVLYTQTKELSVRDELTNVYNRRYFQQVIEKEFKRSERYQRHMSVLMVDVDHFKQFNDTYGHLKGDITLKAIANLLFNNIREFDVLARYGGEEFVVLLPNTELANALKVAEKLRRKIADELRTDIPPASGKTHVPITISIGVASYPEKQSPGELMHAADMALYKAKRQGRNLVISAGANHDDFLTPAPPQKSAMRGAIPKK